MRKVFFAAATVLIGFIIGFWFMPLISSDNVFEQVKKFDRVLQTASRNYVEEVDTQKLVEAAIKGMLEELDVHSVYISADKMKEVEEDFEGKFEGVGVVFNILNDTITIVSPIPGGPSEKLGIMSGDKIVVIDDEDVVGIDMDEVPKKLKGPKGTIVEVDIFRQGEPELLHFAIERDEIPINSVEASFMIDDSDIGVIKVNRFMATTHEEVVAALVNLTTKGMKKVVIDLRGNPGGYLTQSFLMADEFIPENETIVFTKGRRPEFNEVLKSQGGQSFEKLPIIVLIDQGSASASEIFSGAIQDLDRGIIVGQTSYGKGLVQRPYPVGDGSAFRLTISKYYTPSGRCIQRPYDDGDKYRMLVGRFELEEGSYLDDATTKIKDQVHAANLEAENKKDTIDVESLPLYTTKGGRTVFGGGGITPDFIVKYDTITRFSAKIRSRNLFFDFTDQYLKTKGKYLTNKYEDNWQDYYRNFEISDETMEDFKALVIAKDIEWEDDMYQIDKDFLKSALKANIARSIWGREKYLEVFSKMDNQLLKAIELFPFAIDFAKKF
jgi:carboxyl-terminal processing protease